MRTPKILFAIGWLSTALYAPDTKAEPTPISECQRIAAPGSYVLSGNLTAAGDCLVITVDFVTIDLAGFAIIGDGTGSGIRAEAPPSSSLAGIAVRNGTVASFAAGIDLPNANGVVIEALRAINSQGRGIDIGPACILSGNIALGNGSDGIAARTGCTLIGNVARDNGGHGILSGDGTTVSGNSARFNQIGIQALLGSTLTGNVANGNRNLGIVATGTFTGNTSIENGGDGIRAGASSTLAGNTSLNNGDGGIVAFCPTNVVGNTATGNAVTDFRALPSRRGCLVRENAGFR